MSFLRHGEIYRPIRPCGSKPEQPWLDCLGAHRYDEFPAGYSLAGCAPAEPASASPAGAQLEAGRSGSTIEKQRTAGSVLTACLTQGDNPTDILHAADQNTSGTQSPPASLQEARILTKEIRERSLPMRALVLTHPVWGSDPHNSSDSDRKTWEAKMKAQNQPDQFAAQVAGASGLKPADVWVDIPGPAPLEGTAQEGLVKFDDETYLAIVEMFPIGGWLSGYEAYRTISYIFARHERDRVGRAAREVLSTAEYKITVNEVSLKLARGEEKP